MYQGRKVTLIPEGGNLPPKGSTVIFDREFILIHGGKIPEGWRNVMICKTASPTKVLKNIELGEQEVFLSSCIEAAICLADSEAFILGGEKINRSAEPYTGETDVPAFAPDILVPKKLEPKLNELYAINSSAV